jgi:hypothetical protein
MASALWRSCLQDINSALEWIRSNWLPLFVLATVAMTGLALIEHTTSSGIGLRDDSFSYFSGADGFLAGAGFARYSELDGWKPITNFPPFYSFLLSLPQLAGLEAAASARLVAGISYALAAFTLGLLIFWATKSILPAVAAQSVFLMSPSMLEVNSWALSEGPYLACLLISLFLLALLLEQQEIHRGLLGSIIFTLAVAPLTRYAGIVLLGVCFLCMFVLRRPQRNRFAINLAIPLLAITPLLLFLARNALVSDSATNRPLPYWHPPNSQTLLSGASEVLATFFPVGWLHTWPAWLMVASLLLITVVLAMQILKGYRSLRGSRTGTRLDTAVTLLSIHAILYTLFVLFSLYFLDRLIPLNARILAPATVSLIPIGVLLLYGPLQRSGRYAKGLFALLAVLIVFGQSWRGIAQAQALSREGMGFNSGIWRSSQVMEYVREQPDRPIYTNNVPAMYFLANRHATFIPAQFDPASGQTRSDYSQALARMQGVMVDERGMLVIVGSAPRGRIPQDQLRELTESLTLTQEFGDGLVYRFTGD